MRTNCNTLVNKCYLVVELAIHTCARIATDRLNAKHGYSWLAIHTCARIATFAIFLFYKLPITCNSHMRTNCNRAIDTVYMELHNLQFTHAHELQHLLLSCRNPKDSCNSHMRTNCNSPAHFNPCCRPTLQFTHAHELQRYRNVLLFIFT